ncbi:MAG: hypothetical protein JXB04_12480, partial [Kiritimatiellae bacterium]|nr:hypothetical protein [Kiritimatiellia bacterium]
YFYYDVTHPEVKEQAVRATAHVARRTIVFIAQEAGTAMAWGRTGPRIAFALAVVLAGLVLVAFNRRWRMGRLLAGLLGGSVLLYYAGYVLTATPFAVRHVAFVLPVYLAFLALSVWRLSALPPLRRFCGARLRRAVAWVGAAAGLALFVGPAWASMKLIGKPTPYKKVVQVVDQFLPRGAVVLVDRWFDPWNELKVHPSTNVFFTFTVPNEPLDVFKQVNWRQTAMDFLKKYPDAAYLEIAKSYAEVPEIGPWPWPREFFAHHVIITDEAGLRLRAWGLALRDDFYTPNTNRLVVEFFYNTPEDILARARAEGRDVLVLYGPGWKYTKTNDYRDWRVLEDRAELEIHNLTDKTLAARIRLAAVAVGGTKRVDFGTEVVQTFEAHRLTPWEIGTIVLPPGKQVLRINDRLWSLARIPLLVGEVEIQVAGEAAPVVPAEKPQAE